MYKTIFIFITLCHGLLHFIGFAQAFGYKQNTILTNEISKPTGITWSITALMFIFCAILYFNKNNFWPYLALLAVALSQILIIYHWHDARFGSLPNTLILFVALIAIFQIRFKNIYKNEIKIGLEQGKSLQKSILTEADIFHLPDVVKKYIRYTGSMGKPKIDNFTAVFSGKIRDHSKPIWMPLTTEQYNFIEPATRLFFLEATMNSLPVAGFHCFKNGKAYMDIRLLSIFKVSNEKGPEMDISETVTFFNDLCVLAPAALINHKVTWSNTEGNRVRASFTHNKITISAWLYFNEKGELVNFTSDDRYALAKNGAKIKLKWSTPLRDYKIVNGYKLSTYAETIYSYPEGDFTYATFTLKNINYNISN